MKTHIPLAVIILALSLLLAHTTRVAPAAEADKSLVPDGATVEQVATGYRFTEGPASDRAGNVYFTDIPNNRIIKFTPPTRKAEVFLEPSGRANGLMFDRRTNKLIACQGAAEGGQRRLIRFEHDGGHTVLADQYEKTPFNSPNDLTLDAKGGVYFTDPRYGNRDDMAMDIEGVYYRDRHGFVVRVIDDLVRPNGIILSPEGDTLYVADQAGHMIYAYEVNTDGTLANKQEFAKPERGGADGMTVDDMGRLYAATAAGIEVWDRKGERVATIVVPEHPANCAFGEYARNVLYITARTSLYRIKLNAQGL